MLLCGHYKRQAGVGAFESNLSRRHINSGRRKLAARRPSSSAREVARLDSNRTGEVGIWDLGGQEGLVLGFRVKLLVAFSAFVRI